MEFNFQTDTISSASGVINFESVVVNIPQLQNNGISYVDLDSVQTITNKNIDASQINSGTLNITVGVGQGGTGATTEIDGFNVLSPTTTKGDLIVRSNSTNIRLPIGLNGQTLIVDNTQVGGVKWDNIGSTISHSDLLNLTWLDSGHVGLNNRIAGFDGSGNPVYYNIGVDIQGYNSKLDSLSSMSTSGIMVKTGLTTYSTRTIVSSSNVLTVTNPSGLLDNPTLDIVQSNINLGNTSGNIPTSRITDFSLKVYESYANFTNEPNGFIDRISSSLNFNNITRTFSITPVSGSYGIFSKSKYYEINSSNSLQIPNIEGSYFIYYDENGTLQYITGFDISTLLTYAYVALVYWDFDNQKILWLGDERHGTIMDSATHYRLHLQGSRYVSGLALQNFSIDGNGSLDAHSKFEITSGVFLDEDIVFSHSLTTQLPVFYKLGTNGYWRRKDADNYPMIYSGTAGFTSVSGRICFNYFNGSTWSLQEVSNNDYYVLGHVFSINDTSLKNIVVLGNNEYSTLALAREGANKEINSLTGLPFQEYVALGTVIFKTNSTYANTTKTTIVSTDLGLDYVDFRKGSSYQILGFSSDHNLLSNLDKDTHTQYLNITRGDTRYYTKTQSDSAYQPIDSDLTSLSGLSTTGLISRTGSGTSSTRTLTGTAGRITVSNGNGVSGNPTVNLDTSYVGQSTITTLGTVTTGVWNASLLAILYGGTGASTKTVGFNNLSPITTKGDLITSDGTNNVRLGVGSNGFYLATDSTQSTGFKYDYALPFTAFISANGTTTTTSVSDTLLAGITTTIPSTGNWIVIFNAGQVLNSSNSRQNIFTLYNNNVSVADTLRIVGNSSANTDINPVAFMTRISGVQGQTVEVRWRVSGSGTGTCGNRSLLLMKVL